jgi:nicotinamide mononucleotide (NMN) deamidase PncC
VAAAAGAAASASQRSAARSAISQGGGPRAAGGEAEAEAGMVPFGVALIELRASSYVAQFENSSIAYNIAIIAVSLLRRLRYARAASTRSRARE